MPERRIPLLLLLLLLALPAAVAAQELDWEAYEEAARTIRCDCGCHPQSVQDCACGRAAEMRQEIRALVAGEPAAGQPPMTASQIIDRYVAEQGDQILLAPKAQGFNLLAWLGPLVGLALALVGVTLLIQRWHRGDGAGEKAAAEVAAVAENDPYRQRIEQQLRDLQG